MPMQRVLLINPRRPQMKPGTIETLYGFNFVVQDNQDRVCDMPGEFVPDMVAANRVRLHSSPEQDFTPPTVTIQRPAGLLEEDQRPLEELTVPELKALAKQRHVSIPMGTDKAGIIALLQNGDGNG